MRQVLDNGLTVLVREQRGAPVVALQAWVNVGSADEQEREAGLAHLHEHMLFKGTARRGPGRIARDVEARGGEINAWTSFDQTVYHLVLASTFFEEGLDVLADAVQHAAFDPDELAREIEVVIEEIKRGNDQPSRKVSQALFGLAFREHPYRRPVIGFEHTVRSFRRDDVLDFYRRHYTPDNVTVVVVGDVAEAEAVERVRAAFGGAGGRRPPLEPRAVEPEPREARARVLLEPVKKAHLALAWPVPGLRADELAAIDLAAAILGRGDASRLEQEVKLRRGLASEVYAYAYTPRDPGLLVAGATLPPERLASVAEAVLREVYRLRHELVSREELAVARELLESGSIWQRETVQGMARKLGWSETVAGALDFEERYHARLRTVTPEELQRVCETFLRSERLSAVALGPEGLGVDEAKLLALAQQAEQEVRGASRTVRAAPSALAPAAAPRRMPRGAARATPAANGLYREVLPSGVRVLVRPEREVPVVAVRAVYAGGQRLEDEATSGIHHLTARLLTRGTRSTSARALAERSDALSATIAGAAGRNSIGLRGDFLARHLDASFALFAECLREPAFDGAEVERERGRQLQEIRAREDQPSGVAFELFARALYTSHPYRLELLGSERSVSALGPDALADFWRRRYAPDELVVSIVGDVEPEEAFALAAEHLGRIDGAVERLPRIGVAPEPRPVEARRAERQLRKEQAQLVVGFLGARLADPERYALEVLASVLSGQGGRLFTELRDKRSLAYSVSAFSLEGLDPGYFAVYIGCSPEKVDAALDGIRGELGKVLDGPLPEEELARARRYLVGSHAIGLQRNAARAAVLAFDEAYGLGADASARYADRIEAVTPERVLEVARQVIELERSVTALVRP